MLTPANPAKSPSHRLTCLPYGAPLILINLLSFLIETQKIERISLNVFIYLFIYYCCWGMSRSTARTLYREGFSISWILGQDISGAAPPFSLRMWKMKKKRSWCNAVWPKLCHSGIYLCFTFRSHSYLPFPRLGLVLNFKRRYFFFPGTLPQQIFSSFFPPSSLRQCRTAWICRVFIHFLWMQFQIPSPGLQL